jgi:hypothetical protein
MHNFFIFHLEISTKNFKIFTRQFRMPANALSITPFPDLIKISNFLPDSPSQTIPAQGSSRIHTFPTLVNLFYPILVGLVGFW